MPKYNDLDLQWEKRKELERIWTDSLWIVPERDKSGKHSNFYHGNFIPQIPNQFIQRYTKKGDYVIDPFLWSWTTAIECEKLWRNIVWIDIQQELIDRAENIIGNDIKKKFICWDSSSVETFASLKQEEFAQLLLLHPPYFDIIQFSKHENDLSNSWSIEEFLVWMKKVVRNCLKFLKKWGYVWLVIWDKYQNSEWIPLWFHCMQVCQSLWLKLKSIVVKNMEWNRGKQGSGSIWRYRALNSDYYIFKHEYIFIFKKS